MSRHHCLLPIDPPTLRVRDLGSRNGARVNGSQIGRPTGRDAPPVFLASYDLREGDLLEVGHTLFRVRGAVPTDVPPVLVAGEGARPSPPTAGLALGVSTAAEMMTPHVVSIRAGATVEEAAALLTDKGVTAVPVAGPDGRPVGVLSRRDVSARESEVADLLPADGGPPHAPAGGPAPPRGTRAGPRRPPRMPHLRAGVTVARL